MSACRMQMLLKSMHPNRYDMPAEQQVQAAITAMDGDEKKQRQKAAAVRWAEKSEKRKKGGENGDAGRSGSEDVSRRKDCASEDADMEEAIVAEEDVAAEMERDGESGGGDGIQQLSETEGGKGRNGAELQEGGEAGDRDNVEREGGCTVNGMDSSTATEVKKVKYQCRMPTIYGDFLMDLVRKNPELKRMEALTTIIEGLGLSNVQLPEGFPSETKVRRRITAAKYLMKKKHIQSKLRIASNCVPVTVGV